MCVYERDRKVLDVNVECVCVCRRRKREGVRGEVDGWREVMEEEVECVCVHFMVYIVLLHTYMLCMYS